MPEVAARKQLEFIIPSIDLAFRESNLTKNDITAVSFAYGPGLEGSLLIGLIAAKTFSYVLDVPLIGVNHLEGHIFSALPEYPNLSPPFLSLLVSGGHTALIEVSNFGKYNLLGDTRDDAAGEAFDKVAKMLDLGYPGGPIIDKLSKRGNPSEFRFPRANTGKDSFDFSFSGVKTAVRLFWERNRGSVKIEDVAASFQEAVVDAIVNKTERAIKQTKMNKLVLGGGVSANLRLREKLKELSKKMGFELYLPSILMCTDNGVMVAVIGYYKFIRGETSELSLDVVSNLAI